MDLVLRPQCLSRTLMAVVCGGLLFLVLQLLLDQDPVAALVFLLVVAALIAGTWGSKLRIGRTGVEVVNFGLRRSISWAEVLAVEATRYGVVFETARGSVTAIAVQESPLIDFGSRAERVARLCSRMAARQ